MTKPFIDLHTHTTASDGSLTPAELIRLAMTRDLAAIAVTDHDCVDGLQEAMVEGERQGIEIVPGLEISAEYEPGTMHILGLFVDSRATSLQARLTRLKEARSQRNPEIIRRLQALGLAIREEEVVAASGGGLVGRPHFAKVLVQKGYVGSIEEAFERYLKKGAPAYVDKFRYSPKEAIEMIQDAGGVAALAHPFTLGLQSPPQADEAMRALIADLIQCGLDGMEVYYSTNSPKDTLHYLQLCDSYGLLPTGGSDFHGVHKPGIELGVGRGDLQIPVTLLEAIRKKADQHRRRKGHEKRGSSRAPL